MGRREMALRRLTALGGRAQAGQTQLSAAARSLTSEGLERVAVGLGAMQQSMGDGILATCGGSAIEERAGWRWRGTLEEVDAGGKAGLR